MEPEFVFIDFGNPFYVRPWGGEGDWWIFYWHPDNHWVSLRKVSRGEKRLTRAVALPAKDAELYHAQHREWEARTSSEKAVEP